MGDPFVHLRVASGYSLRYGASHPSELVQRAADLEMDTCALTDRDGLYGAVRFAKACLRTGIAPVLGVDLAVLPILPEQARGWERTPARGGVERDRRLPRVVLLATSRAGWATLCRLVSATHLGGERGTPIADPQSIARGAADGGLAVLLGADSEYGVAVASGHRQQATAVLDRWRRLVEREHLVVAVTNHHNPGSGVGTARQAGRMLALADTAGIPVVLTNAVRMAERHQAPTVDVLDSARRLVPLGHRNVDRRNAEGYLKSGKEMLEVAEEVARHGGRGDHGAERLLEQTRRLAARCRLDPRVDLGLGETHLPELSVLNTDGPASGARASATDALAVLRQRCEAGISHRFGRPGTEVADRLADELAVIDHHGYATYFLTVADVVDLIKEMGVRCAARGSGAGSLVNYLLGVSGVDPLRHGLVMERFLSVRRAALPDVDLDVESARRLEVYEKILATFGGERVACVAMLDTYRVRHAVRDVGAALSLPPAEVDAIAKAFPHIRARDARAALRDLPELRSAGLADRRLDLLFSLVESLDGLPRHIALHPCGVLLSDASLLDRTPVEASHAGFPMSQFDKDDVEDLGLLKLDVLGIRMQSSMAHAVEEIDRTEGERIDVDQIPFDDDATFTMIRNAATLGCFQIESPGQRELVGKFAPETFGDLIIDISLFRPGPVKSDMVNPFLRARQGWELPRYLHPDLEPHLRETCGVVVFHEQVIKIIGTVADCDLATADEARRALGDLRGKEDVRAWLLPRARQRGYDEATVTRIWEVLEAFASFGFCKAHAAAFALPTYQSAWLKAHWPAHFLAGVLTHDPGMYPKRLILDEARRLGIAVLSLDVNASDGSYRVERVGRYDEPPPSVLGQPPRLAPGAGLPDGRDFGIRMSLADVKGITETEVGRIVAGRPYRTLADFWARAGVTAPVVERLVLAGAFDSLYGIGATAPVRRRQRITRRDLLLTVADLQRDRHVDRRAHRSARGLRPERGLGSGGPGRVESGQDPRDLARRQSATTPAARPAEVQLPLDFTDPDASEETPADELVPSGLPELSDAERVAAELDILGMDASRHVVDFYLPLLEQLGVSFAADLLSVRDRRDVLIAGVKVATQTPPVRSGRRVVFLTLDDTTGPADATFFEDAQGPYAATLFSSWLLLVRGELRRTGPRGVSLRATGCWDLRVLYERWQQAVAAGADEEQARAAVRDLMDAVPEGFGIVGDQLDPDATTTPSGERPDADAQQHTRAGGMGRRRVLVHASGFRQSPYADIEPAGVEPTGPPRKVWHTSPGSSGR
ncbi:MAG: DNA polymerase III subunit alpha [Propionibacteriaceae bacterium]